MSYTKRISTLLSLLLLASALSLGSCVNEVKNPVKTQDTLSKLKIVYNIPDSNEVLAVHFHAVMTPPWQKNYRIDWNFGDSTGIISKFDTSNLLHNFQKYGSYQVTLSVFDTVSKSILGKNSMLIDLEDNAIDTNFLHAFKNVSMIFSGVRQYDSGRNVMNLTMNNFQTLDPYYQSCPSLISRIQWYGNSFTLYSEISQDVIERIWINCYISHTGNSIDSGNYIYRHIKSEIYPHGFSELDQKAFLQYHNLPLIRKDYDTIIFSFKGSNLKNLIPQYSDSTGMYYYYNPSSNKLRTVLWDEIPNPSLTVIFYK